MTDIFTEAAYTGADNVRGLFGIAAANKEEIKPGVVAGLKQSLNSSYGQDAAPGMHFNNI